MISASEIRELFKKHSLDGPVPAGLTLRKVVPDSPYGPLKLRAYPDAATAEERLHYLDACRAAGIQAPAVRAHEGRYVIFDLMPVEKAGRDEKSLRALGHFLGTLNAIPTDPVDPAEFFTEASVWLANLAQTRLLHHRTSRFILDHLKKSLPTGIRTAIDYWDAMPHNFGRHSGDFYLLDEKHTRHSFCGVGLVKPLLIFSEGEWNAVRAGYAEVADLAEFDRCRPFLTYYYLLAALYFYSLITAAGRIDPAVNTRFLRYRRMLLAQTTGLPLRVRIFADLHFILSHPRSLPHLLRLGSPKTAPSSSAS